MKYVDLTHGFYQGMPAFPATWYPEFKIHYAMTPDSDPSGYTRRTFTSVEIFAHNATHVDVPLHFFEDRASLDQVPMDVFMGRAVIADLSHKQPLEPITADDIEAAVRDVWQPGDRLLVRTDYLRDHWGREDFYDRPPYLTPSMADWAVENQASLVGLDCITELPGDKTSPVHLRLLGARIPILEYLTNMDQASTKTGFLMALPMKVAGVEAAPVRAIYIEDFRGGF